MKRKITVVLENHFDQIWRRRYKKDIQWEGQNFVSYEKIHKYYIDMEGYSAKLSFTCYSNKTQNSYFAEQLAKAGGSFYTNVTPGDKSFSVTTVCDGKKIKTVKTNSKGVATFNVPQKYLPKKKITIKATALGKSASKKVTVKQILSIKTVKVKKSTKKRLFKHAIGF